MKKEQFETLYIFTKQNIALRWGQIHNQQEKIKAITEKMGFSDALELLAEGQIEKIREQAAALESNKEYRDANRAISEHGLALYSMIILQAFLNSDKAKKGYRAYKLETLADKAIEMYVEFSKQAEIEPDSQDTHNKEASWRYTFHNTEEKSEVEENLAIFNNSIGIQADSEATIEKYRATIKNAIGFVFLPAVGAEIAVAGEGQEGKKPIIGQKFQFSQEYNSVSNARIFNDYMSVLDHKGDMKQLKAAKEAINHNTHITVTEDNKSILIESADRKSKEAIILADIEGLLSSSIPAKKVLHFVMTVAAQQVTYQDNEKSYVTFALEDMVKAKLYSSDRAARAGLNTAFKVLDKIKIGGVDAIHKKLSIYLDKDKKCEGFTLFLKYDIVNGQCFVYFNPIANLAAFGRYFTIAPSYIYSLGSNAFDLTTYIFSLARANKKEIASKGYFDITMKAIALKLVLPLNSDKPQRDVMDRIAKAVQEVSEAEAAKPSQGMTLQMKNTDNVSLAQFLSNGFLRVKFSGEYRKYFSDIAETQERKIAEAIKRAEEKEAKKAAKNKEQ